jgi:hypothetical protein
MPKESYRITKIDISGIETFKTFTYREDVIDFLQKEIDDEYEIDEMRRSNQFNNEKYNVLVRRRDVKQVWVDDGKKANKFYVDVRKRNAIKEQNEMMYNKNTIELNKI